jgi:hypothetical protein
VPTGACGASARPGRAEAIADGVLIDVSAVAREAVIRYPVALTAAAWAKRVAVPPGVPCQDEAGRLWDVLWTPLHQGKRRRPVTKTRAGAIRILE